MGLIIIHWDKFYISNIKLMNLGDWKIPILHHITPRPKKGEFCKLIESDHKAISLIKVINKYRKKKGLYQIEQDNNLCMVALLHSYDQFVSVIYSNFGLN